MFNGFPGCTVSYYNYNNSVWTYHSYWYGITAPTSVILSPRTGAPLWSWKSLTNVQYSTYIVLQRRHVASCSLCGLNSQLSAPIRLAHIETWSLFKNKNKNNFILHRIFKITNTSCQLFIFSFFFFFFETWSNDNDNNDNDFFKTARPSHHP